MSGTCSTYDGEREEMQAEIWQKNLKGNNHSGDLGAGWNWEAVLKKLIHQGETSAALNQSRKDFCVGDLSC
jgi:hypothetical protein